MVDAAQEGTTGARLLPLFPIAQGGMGSVEVAVRRDGSFQRLYAIKRIRQDLVADDDARKMFDEEARIAGAVRHPNVVSVLDVQHGDDGPFLVMDYVEGLSASSLVRLLVREGKELPVQLAVEIARQASEGLHAVHTCRGVDGKTLGVIHRDVTPSNVLIGYDGSVRVTDFGIAKAIDRSLRTSTGVLKGKLNYLAPEQLQFKEPGVRSDIFALGLVLYELLAGGPLYEPSLTGARRILHEPPSDPRLRRKDIPAELASLVQQCIAKDPDKRPHSAKAVAQRLLRMQADMLATEGVRDLAEFVAENFSARREAMRARIESATHLRLEALAPMPLSLDGSDAARGGDVAKRAEIAPSTMPDIEVLIDRTGQITKSTAPSTTRRSVRKQRVIPILAALALVSGVAWALTTEPPAPGADHLPVAAPTTAADSGGVVLAEERAHPPAAQNARAEASSDLVSNDAVASDGVSRDGVSRDGVSRDAVSRDAAPSGGVREPRRTSRRREPRQRRPRSAHPANTKSGRPPADDDSTTPTGRATWDWQP